MVIDPLAKRNLKMSVGVTKLIYSLHAESSERETS